MGFLNTKWYLLQNIKTTDTPYLHSRKTIFYCVVPGNAYGKQDC